MLPRFLEPQLEERTADFSVRERAEARQTLTSITSTNPASPTGGVASRR